MEFVCFSFSHNIIFIVYENMSVNYLDELKCVQSRYILHSQLYSYDMDMFNFALTGSERNHIRREMLSKPCYNRTIQQITHINVNNTETRDKGGIQFHKRHSISRPHQLVKA